MILLVLMISLGSHGHIFLEKNLKLLISLKCFALNFKLKMALTLKALDGLELTMGESLRMSPLKAIAIA